MTDQTPAPVAGTPNFDTMEHTDYRAFREGRQTVVEAKPAVVETPSADSADEAEPTTAADSETASEEQDPQEDKKKKKGGFQKRIDKLTARTAELEKQLADKSAVKPAEQQQTAASQNASPETPTGKPELKDFSTYEEYVEKLADWRYDQREAQREQAQKAAKAADQAKEAGKQWQERLTDARTRYEDFDSVALAEVPISQAVHQVIVSAENGPDLAYYLGQHPEERELINAMTPVKATLALGRISAKLETSSDPETEVKPKVSAAPPPIKPLGAKNAQSSKRPEEMSHDEYRKARESGKIR